MNITGKLLAESVFKDVESFFFYSHKFKIKCEYESNSRLHASVVSDRIRLSNDFCSKKINNLDDLFFFILIICHEIAHYINYHNTHVDNSIDETKALEIRADNFGAQIAMTVITLGKSTGKIINEKYNSLDHLGESKCKTFTIALGKAVYILHKDIFLQNNSDRYPSASTRILSVIAGFLSFFHRYNGVLTEKFTIWFILTILLSSNITSLIDFNNVNKDNKLKLNEIIHNIHKHIQNEQKLMTCGMKPIFGMLLISDFQIEKSERKAYQKKLENMVNFGFLNIVS